MKTILIICSCLMSVCAACQHQLAVGTGYGYFNISDLKSFQESQLASFPVEAEITSSFPPYLIYGASWRALLKHDLMIGVSGAIGSTGSRAYYEDYSGSIGFDQLLRFTSLGLAFGGWGKFGQGNLFYYVDLNPGVTFTSMKMRSFYTLGANGTIEKTAKVKSINVTTQPTVSLIRRFGSVGLNLFVGYHLTIVPGKLKPKGNKDAYLVHEGIAVKADWSGLRVGLNVSLFLKRSSSSDGP